MDGERSTSETQERATDARPRARAPRRVVAACLVALVVGATGLAAAGALTGTSERTAGAADHPHHGDRDRHHGPECGPVVEKNHGAYVRGDHSLARSECGKKEKRHERSDAARRDRRTGDACHGKPAWASNKAMTDAEKDAAKAARAAACGADDDERSRARAADGDAHEPDETRAAVTEGSERDG